jgi:RNA polymerase sigma-70 factor (ECF subfamily)
MSTEMIDFRKLLELHASAIRSALRRYGGSRMPVEDGLQEVFELAVRKYDGARPPDAWLLTAAFNVAQNWRRKAQHAREVAGLDADAEDDATPDYWFTLAERRRGIHATIDTLDEEDREVFILAEIESMPLATIAATLNLPLRTVRFRLDRARQAFFKEADRRRAAGLLGVLAVLQGQAESRSRAAANRYFENAGWALFGGAVVAALFYLTRPPPARIPIHAEPREPAVIADTRSILLPAPPVRNASQPAPHGLVPASSPPQASPAERDDSLRDQLTLLDTATQAIDQGRYREALRLLERVPDGPMSADRNDLVGQANRFIAASKVGLAARTNR